MYIITNEFISKNLNMSKDLKERIEYLEKIVFKINSLNLDALRRLNWKLSKFSFKQSVLEFGQNNLKESSYYIGKALKYFERSKE